MKTIQAGAVAPAPITRDFNAHVLICETTDRQSGAVETAPVCVFKETEGAEAATRRELVVDTLVKCFAEGNLSEFSSTRTVLEKSFGEQHGWAEFDPFEGGELEHGGRTFRVRPFDLSGPGADAWWGTKVVVARDENGRFVLAASLDIQELVGKLVLADSQGEGESGVIHYRDWLIDVVTPRSIGSPFMQPSPFRVRDGHPCLLNQEGELQEENYDYVQPVGGVYVVGKDGRYGLVDRQGGVIAPCVYHGCSIESGDRFCLRKDGEEGQSVKYGFYDIGQAILCEPRFDDIDFGEEPDDLLRVEQDGETGYLDTDLNFYTLDQFDEGACDGVSLL